jgi:4-hydroxyphenylpyruvate 3-dimethylallyltransferase
MAVHTFTEETFLSDATALARAVDAPFDPQVAHRVLDVFGDEFRTGGVQWKTTSRPGDLLHYRYFPRRRANAVKSAIEGGLLGEGRQTELVDAWSSAFSDSSVQFCDFDGVGGLAKIWVYFGGLPSIDTVLAAVPSLPGSVTELLGTFERVGLTRIRYTAVDPRSDSVNLYFRIPGPFTTELCERVLTPVGLPVPAAATIAAISPHIREHISFALTFSMTTGRAERACVYALNVPARLNPPLPERINTFYAAAPCDDPQTVRITSWSLGHGTAVYIKAEQSYSGDLAGLLQSWNCG